MDDSMTLNTKKYTQKTNNLSIRLTVLHKAILALPDLLQRTRLRSLWPTLALQSTAARHKSGTSTTQLAQRQHAD
jgi:hypothetical protein